MPVGSEFHESAQRAHRGKLHIKGHGFGMGGKPFVHKPQNLDGYPDGDNANHRARIKSCAESQPDTCHRPQPGGGGQAFYLVLPCDEYGSGTKKADAADDLGRDAAGVSRARDVRDIDAHHHGEGSAETYDHIGAETCGTVLFFPFVAEDAAEEHGEQKAHRHG